MACNSASDASSRRRKESLSEGFAAATFVQDIASSNHIIANWPPNVPVFTDAEVLKDNGRYWGAPLQDSFILGVLNPDPESRIRLIPYSEGKRHVKSSCCDIDQSTTVKFDRRGYTVFGPLDSNGSGVPICDGPSPLARKGLGSITGRQPSSSSKARHERQSRRHSAPFKVSKTTSSLSSSEDEFADDPEYLAVARQMFDECCSNGDYTAAEKLSKKLWKAYRGSGQVAEAFYLKTALRKVQKGKGKDKSIAGRG